MGAYFPIEERMGGEGATGILPRIFAIKQKWGSKVEGRRDEWVLLEAGVNNPGGKTCCCREGCVITKALWCRASLGKVGMVCLHGM